MREAIIEDYPDLVKVWEASVRATHDFIPEDYILYIKDLLPTIFPQVQVFVETDAGNRVVGFLGVEGKKIEMLFIDPGYRGNGIGKSLVHFALNRLHADEVDVNEQNEQAVSFYQKTGFVVYGRSDTDSLGKPYPLLHMKWKPKAMK